MTTLRLFRSRTLVALVVAVVASAVVAAAAAAHPTAKVVGNSKAGKTVFSANCASCHTLKAAKATGAIGPDLDKVKLTEAVLVKAVTNGGASVMTKAAASKYSIQMTPYKGTLSKAQIQNVAAFIYVSTH